MGKHRREKKILKYKDTHGDRGINKSKGTEYWNTANEVICP